MTTEKTMKFRAVTDFLDVPADKIEHCLEDFRLWLGVCREARANGINVLGGDTFGWVDDGKHDMNVNLTITVKNERVNS